MLRVGPPTAKYKSIFAKRHYQFVASHMASIRGRMTPDEWVTHVLWMCALFKKENHAFITVRFMQACGMTRGEANRALEGHDL